MDPSYVAAMIDAFQQARVVNYAHVSALAIMIYDIFTTLDLEMTHIWAARWSPPKVLYLIARYYALFHLSLVLAVDVTLGVNLNLTLYANHSERTLALTSIRCNGFFRINGFGLQLLADIADALLIMRLRCMYNNSKRVTLVLGALFVIQAIIQAVVIGFSTSNSGAVEPPPGLSAQWPGCFYTSLPPRYDIVAWLTSLLFAIILFAMTLHKLWQFRCGGMKAGGLFVIFAQDGVMFFATIFVLELLNTVVTWVVTISDGRLLGIGVPWTVACYGIVSSRLVLNVREYGAEMQQLSLPSRSKTTAESQHIREAV
ncbi:hypothetical protein AURDEDRAFT_169918 [Auricularia subglabra TFB-10046 SS5]|uniref:DUF6533 domain-containing protein n=1 Tax=Auricularia subglabra (strain TFB-10046 / SS5) TaxID=717982 RepID=J0LJX6_AURST|nr:hypothetical protein AURDEDRAFT_169918 [Auricularia subglabra TFB-10046 SS5]